jgi:hypothetical protein
MDRIHVVPDIFFFLLFYFFFLWTAQMKSVCCTYQGRERKKRSTWPSPPTHFGPTFLSNVHDFVCMNFNGTFPISTDVVELNVAFNSLLLFSGCLVGLNECYTHIYMCIYIYRNFFNSHLFWLNSHPFFFLVYIYIYIYIYTY